MSRCGIWRPIGHCSVRFQMRGTHARGSFMQRIRARDKKQTVCLFAASDFWKPLLHPEWMSVHTDLLGAGAGRDLHMHAGVHGMRKPTAKQRAGLTQADSILAYVRSYFCFRLAIHLPPRVSVVVLGVSLVDTGRLFNVSSPASPTSLLPPHLISLIFNLARFMTLCNRTNSSRVGRGISRHCAGEGLGGQRELCHCPSYFSTEGSYDITTALLPDLSVAIQQH